MASHIARALFFMLTLCGALTAKADAPIPALSGSVIDLASTLSSQQQRALQQTLHTFKTRYGNQIIVLLIASTEPESIEQYTLRVAERWQLGHKKLEDGVLLVVATDARIPHIEIGDGLQSVLNDATRKRIISEQIIPYLEQGDINGGISAGIEQITRVLDGKPLLAPHSTDANGYTDARPYFPVVIIIALAIGSVLPVILGRFAGALTTGGVIALLAWFATETLTVAVLTGVLAVFFTLFTSSMTSTLLLNGSSKEGKTYSGGSFGGGGASGRW